MLLIVVKLSVGWIHVTDSFEIVCRVDSCY